ncbi:MAG: WHG domain-containing protein [Gordonia sp. (in: high G+C Gram-positive bacteria)]
MAATTPGRRAENRAAMTAAIRRLGREHLSTHGAAGLSLRAIARDLGIVSSAVYRYVPSRDDLLTALLVEGYTDLADAVDAAIATVDETECRARIVAACRAARQWGVADAARWALLYGSPVPGYAAPPEQTAGPGTRVVGALLAELARAHALGQLATALPAVPADTADDLAGIRAEFGVNLPDPAIALGTALWATLIGAVGLEVFGQYGPGGFGAAEPMFTVQLGPVLDALFGAT